MDLNLATNDELKEMSKSIENEFQLTKEKLQEDYDKLVELSEKYNTIRNIINKREGK